LAGYFWLGWLFTPNGRTPETVSVCPSEFAVRRTRC
jgi:hypothetical protein